MMFQWVVLGSVCERQMGVQNCELRMFDPITYETMCRYHHREARERCAEVAEGGRDARLFRIT